MTWLRNLEAVETTVLTRVEVLSILKTNWEKAQRRMKLTVDKHKRDLSFSEGDWVYVKLQADKQISIVELKHHKILECYFGPY